MTRDGATLKVYLEKIRGRSSYLVKARGRDEDAAALADAEIAAGRRNPSARIAGAGRRTKVFDLLVQQMRVLGHT